MPPLQHLNCAVCDDQHSESSEEPDSNTIETVFKPAILVFEKLVQSQHFMESRRPRILAMLALRKFVNHIQIPELFDLSISSLGQWCLRSLRSSTRELRIAAGYVWLCTLRIPLIICKSNYTIVFNSTCYSGNHHKKEQSCNDRGTTQYS